MLVTALTICFSVVTGRLIQLQWVKHEGLSKIVEQNRTELRTLHAGRGDVVDVRGNLLAGSREVYAVGVDPHSLSEDIKPGKKKKLARILGVEKKTLEKKFSRRTRLKDGPHGPKPVDVRWVELADQVDQKAYERVQELGIRGVYGNRKFERYYPAGETAAHLLGFVNKQGVPVTGIERFMDFYLSGQDGWRRYEEDGKQRELVQYRDREIPPRHGFHVELTIDTMAQHMVEEVMGGLVEKYQPKGATVIVSEPATGSIIALANYPSFDPNEYQEYPIGNHRNRAVTDIMEPGSTFKAMTVAAAFNEGLVDPQDRLDVSQEYVEYDGREISLPSDHKNYDELSVEEILVKSSNRGAALLGMLLGEEKLYEYAKAFGFGERTGYGPSAEENGILHEISEWDGLTISRMPMGHAVSATPLQIHYAMATIANDGISVKPRVVKRVFEKGNDAAEIRFDPKPSSRVLKPRVARNVCEIMTGVASERGTAKKARIPGFEVAGKTGTTQKIINGRYSSKHHISSFVGFFPASNPELVISVFVDDAQMSGYAYGGLVAAPAFRKIGEKLIRYMGIQPVQKEKSQLALENNDAFDWTN